MVALLVAASCGGASPPSPPPAAPAPSAEPARSAFAADDGYQPSYAKPELLRALAAERALAATEQRRVAELDEQSARQADPALSDQLYTARADLAVRHRFIATLEACDAAQRWCPPRLDDPPWSYDIAADPAPEPPVTSTLRFDLDSWRALAGELHGRACACRTIGCVDGVGVAIDRLELRPVPQVRGDEAATLSITWARECLFRLRGRSVVPVTRAAPSPVLANP